MKKEMMEMLENLVSCEGCPFAGICHKDELFWECPVWEDAMGEDL